MSVNPSVLLTKKVMIPLNPYRNVNSVMYLWKFNSQTYSKTCLLLTSWLPVCSGLSSFLRALWPRIRHDAMSGYILCEVAFRAALCALGGSHAHVELLTVRLVGHVGEQGLAPTRVSASDWNINQRNIYRTGLDSINSSAGFGLSAVLVKC